MIKTKTCLRCNANYQTSANNSKRCEACLPIHKRERAAIDQQAYRVKHGLIQKPGVGKGGNTKKGEEHHSFTTGVGCNFQNVRRKMKEERRYCESCQKDLIEATRYQWCVHHIDHDRTNNVEANFQLLCKRCHQIEHECHKAFGTCND